MRAGRFFVFAVVCFMGAGLADGGITFDEAISRPHTVLNLHQQFSESLTRAVTIFNGHQEFSESITRAVTVKNLFCIEDIDRDGSVGPADLALLLGAWGPNEFHPADLNDDGEVGAFDLAILLGAWGPCE